MINKNMDTVIENLLNPRTFRKALFTAPIKYDDKSFKKVSVLPVYTHEQVKYRFSYFFESKTVYTNLGKAETIEEIKMFLTQIFRQAFFTTNDAQYLVSLNSNGDLDIKESLRQQFSRKKRFKQTIPLHRNSVPFLFERGIMNHKGKIINDKYAKYKQITKFVNFFDSLLVNNFSIEDEIKVVDFECNRAYFTFAINHFLSRYNLDIKGFDRKKELIAENNRIVNKYGLEGIKFYQGGFFALKDEKIDIAMAISMYDTNADYFLATAIKKQAKLILCVPVFQHELTKQIVSDKFSILLEDNILKEQFCSILTNAMFIKILEINGYTCKTRYIDDAYTNNKRTMIVATRSNDVDTKKAKEDLEKIKSEFKVELTLERLLKENN